MKEKFKRLGAVSIVALAIAVIILMEIAVWKSFAVHYRCSFVSVGEDGSYEETEELDPAVFLNGASDQYLSLGGETSPVQAIDGFGYRFLEWSDGTQETARQDRTLSNVTYTAYFAYDFGDMPFLFSGESYVSFADGTRFDAAVEREEVKTGYPSYKYSYRITFSKPTSLLDMSADAMWQLLPVSQDPTLMRDRFGMEMARELDFAFASEARQVVFFHEGQFIGVYLLCRAFPSDSEWLFESGNAVRVGLETLDNGVYGQQVFSGAPYGLPDHSYKIAKSQSYYLSQVVLPRVYNAIYLDGSYEAVSSVLDVESAVSAYLMTELMKNSVAGEKGVLMRYAEGKVFFVSQTYYTLSAGLDRRFASAEGSVFDFTLQEEETEGEYNGFPQYLLYGLSRLDWFRSLAAERWKLFSESGAIERGIEGIRAAAAADERNLVSDKTKYPFFSSSNEVRVDEWPYYDPDIKENTYAEHVGFLCDWLTERKLFLDVYFEGEL